MKTFALLALILSPFSSAAFGASAVCPENTVEMTRCKSDNFASFYPYVAMCKAGNGYTMMLNAGGSDGYTDVARAESDAGTLFTTTSKSMDGLNILFPKVAAGSKTKAVLSFMVFGRKARQQFTCTAIQE